MEIVKIARERDKIDTETDMPHILGKRNESLFLKWFTPIIFFKRSNISQFYLKIKSFLL